MPAWKKVALSGSSTAFHHITASGNISTPTHGNISRNLFDTANTNSSTHGYLHGGRGFEIVGSVDRSTIL